MPSKRPASSGSDDNAAKCKHVSISIQKKVELLQNLEKSTSGRALCGFYNSKKQKNQILNFFAKSNCKKSMSVCKTLKEGGKTVIVRLYTGSSCIGMKVFSISGEMVMAQAKIFHKELNLQHECDCLQGWLQKFKNRHGICLHCVCSGKRSPDTEVAAKYIDIFAQLVANEKLFPEQVYNADETDLYWRCMPKIMMATDGLGEENLLDWIEVDKDALIASQMTYEESVQMIQQGKNKDNEEEKIYIDKCIQLATNFIKGLEQRHFISEQEIMSLYVVKSPTPKRAPRWCLFNFYSPGRALGVFGDILAVGPSLAPGLQRHFSSRSLSAMEDLE
uniref:HTH CENPB-type domain-containing protein n=1 Tax=Gopherus agassizii TaxID=38772 RepID=A0A452IGB6_9SAUR